MSNEQPTTANDDLERRLHEVRRLYDPAHDAHKVATTSLALLEEIENLQDERDEALEALRRHAKTGGICDVCGGDPDEGWSGHKPDCLLASVDDQEDDDD